MSQEVHTTGTFGEGSSEGFAPSDGNKLNNAMSIIDTLGGLTIGVIGAFKGGGNPNYGRPVSNTGESTNPQRSQVGSPNTTWIIVGLIAIVVIGGLLFFKKGGK